MSRGGRIYDASILAALRAGMTLEEIRAVDAHNEGLSLLAARCKNQRERTLLAEMIRCPHCRALHMLNEQGQLVVLRHYDGCPALRRRN